MKVPIGWLADFIDLPTRDPHELERILVSLGHEVEGIEEFGPSFEGVVVGRVEEVRPHPDADRIRFCRVDDGTVTRDVVCGAWNFEAGAVIAYARAGSRLGTSTDQPLEVGSRKIRGIVSHGMIASARELGLGDDHEGIMVLDELGAATEDDLGRSLEEVIGLGDVVLDVSITTNRGDCMGIRGLARELAAYWQVPLRTSPRASRPVRRPLPSKCRSTTWKRVPASLPTRWMVCGSVPPHYGCSCVSWLSGNGPSPTWWTYPTT